MSKEIKATRPWVEGDRVTWHGRGVTEIWKARYGKPATVIKDQAKHAPYTRVLFDGDQYSVLAISTNLKAYVDPPKPKTLHDEAREQFELAMTYAEDGAIATAAFMLEQIAQEYRKRANMILAEIEGKTNG